MSEPGTTASDTTEGSTKGPLADHRFTGRQSSAGPLVFVLSMLLLVGGFWLMAISFDHESGVLFGAGLLVAGLAFLIPLARADH